MNVSSLSVHLCSTMQTDQCSPLVLLCSAVSLHLTAVANTGLFFGFTSFESFYKLMEEPYVIFIATLILTFCHKTLTLIIDMKSRWTERWTQTSSTVLRPNNTQTILCAFVSVITQISEVNLWHLRQRKVRTKTVSRERETQGRRNTNKVRE